MTLIHSAEEVELRREVEGVHTKGIGRTSARWGQGCERIRNRRRRSRGMIAISIRGSLDGGKELVEAVLVSVYSRDESFAFEAELVVPLDADAVHLEDELRELLLQDTRLLGDGGTITIAQLDLRLESCDALLDHLQLLFERQEDGGRNGSWRRSGGRRRGNGVSRGGCHEVRSRLGHICDRNCRIRIH